MFEESRENTGGVIAGMLRSLEDGHLDIVPSAELKKAELAACCFAQRMRKSRKKNENFTSLSYNKKKNMKKRLQRLTACKMKGPCCKKAAGVVLCKQSFSRDKKAV